MFFTGNYTVIAANLTAQRELNLICSEKKGRELQQQMRKTIRKWCCNSTTLPRPFYTYSSSNFTDMLITPM